MRAGEPEREQRERGSEQRGVDAWAGPPGGSATGAARTGSAGGGRGGRGWARGGPRGPGRARRRAPGRGHAGPPALRSGGLRRAAPGLGRPARERRWRLGGGGRRAPARGPFPRAASGAAGGAGSGGAGAGLRGRADRCRAARRAASAWTARRRIGAPARRRPWARPSAPAPPRRSIAMHCVGLPYKGIAVRWPLASVCRP